MEAMTITQQIVDDVRATLRSIIDSGVDQPELPLEAVTPGGRSITIWGVVNGQYTVDVVPSLSDIYVTLTISEHLP